MSEIIEIEGKQYEVIGHADDGLPILRGTAVTVEHKDENGEQIFDADGNPKISVNVNVTPLLKQTTAGEAA